MVANPITGYRSCAFKLELVSCWCPVQGCGMMGQEKLVLLALGV